MELTIRQLEETILYSNSNIEKVARAIINESSNAALVAMYEDSVVLIDHDAGSFYSADYVFEAETATFTFNNFERIELEKEEFELSETIKDFLDDENYSYRDLVESYKNSVLSQERFLNSLISESLSHKDFSEIIDYSALEGVCDSSITKEPFFESYKERLQTNPLNEVKYFNWRDEVKVSLLESEPVKLINTSAKEKANGLWKNKKFKDAITEAMITFIDDVETGKAEIFETIKEYPSVFFLDNADRKSLFGKTIIANSELREHLQILQKGLSIIFEDEEILELQENYITEMEEEPTGEDEVAADAPKAKELTPEELKKLADELRKVCDKVDDDSVCDKVKDIADKLEGTIEEGTRPDLIKEAVQILSF